MPVIGRNLLQCVEIPPTPYQANNLNIDRKFVMGTADGSPKKDLVITRAAMPKPVDFVVGRFRANGILGIASQKPRARRIRRNSRSHLKRRIHPGEESQNGGRKLTFLESSSNIKIAPSPHRAEAVLLSISICVAAINKFLHISLAVTNYSYIQFNVLRPKRS